MSFMPDEVDYTAKFSIKLWGRMLKKVKPYWKTMGLVALFLSLMGVVDIFFPLITRYAIDHFIVPRSMAGLTPFVAVYLGLIVVQAGFILLFIWYASKVDIGSAFHLREQGFRKLMELPFSYYDRMPVGMVLSRLTSDVTHVAEAFGWGFVDLIWAGVFLFGTLLAMFLIEWKLAIVCTLVLPLLGLVSYLFNKKLLGSYRHVRKANARVTAQFNEGIMGAKTTKTLVREEQNAKEFAVETKNMRKASIKALTMSALLYPVVSTLGVMVTAYVVSEGSALVLKGAMTLGTIAAFVDYTIRFFHPVQDIAATLAELQRMQAAVERVNTLLETEPDIKDTEAVVRVYGDNFNPLTENWPPLSGAVGFDHVSFKYKDGEEVLKDFNLSVSAGQTIALVGPTGAGKSTIVNLLCRFYEPTGGTVSIDGVDYRERSQLWLQSNLGYVLQEPHLFSGTIADNIRYGRPGATMDEVEAAAKLVRADSFISKMDKGYDSPVGEGGNLLSTGEKQLVSFARAILHDPKLFVLDEATSSVDTETEFLIQRAIEKTLQGRTSFIIAHRLSTIRHADRILFIQDGKIAEDGTHDALIAQKGLYYTLYTNQFVDEMTSSVMVSA